ncbi:MAG: hypothetical protein ACOC8F_07130, partial [Planctomycetota bacterium]
MAKSGRTSSGGRRVRKGGARGGSARRKKRSAEVRKTRGEPAGRREPGADEARDACISDDGHDIVVVGAKQHNLDNIDVRIPRDKLVVVTGLSGSGKSSLAFDTIYAEGQRKYVESLSAYARQFLEQLAKPDVEHIEGLPPTVAIEQRAGGANPRSTVATTTEIYDYLRLLFARVGTPHCWLCGREITSQTVTLMVDAIFTLPEGTRFMVLAPVIRGQKGQHVELLQHMQREGYVRVRIDGAIHELTDLPEIDKNRRHTIEVVVDRLVLRESVRVRLSDSIETALELSNGLVVICHETPADAEDSSEPSAKPQAASQAQRGSVPAKPLAASQKSSNARKRSAGTKDHDRWTDWLFSATYACPVHPEANLEELAPRMFSFNSPYGACTSCDGLGTILEFDPDLIVPDPSLSLSEGAVDAWRHGGKRMNIFYNRAIRRFCRKYRVSANRPFEELPAETRKKLLHGDPRGGWEGVIPNLTRRWRKTDSEYVKARLHSFMSEQACPKCGGGRLRPASLAVTIADHNINDIVRMDIASAVQFFDQLRLGAEQAQIAEMILREIRHRLRFLADVGLDYVTLDRASATLSGGEAQRIRLATQVGSGLVGV